MTSISIRKGQHESQTLRGINRRASKRYAVRTLVQYRTSGGARDSAWKCGRTLDMSVSGILIDTPEGLPVGSTVELAIDWMGLYHGKPMVRLFVIGSVVRNDGRGTALRILKHEFRDVRSAVISSRHIGSASRAVRSFQDRVGQSFSERTNFARC